MFTTHQCPSARLLKEPNTVQIFQDAHAATGTLLRDLNLKSQIPNLTNHQADKISGLLAGAESKFNNLQVASNLS